MGFVEKFIFWIIPLVVLIILAVVYFGEDSFFSSLKDTVNGIIDFTSISIGSKELSSEQQQLNPNSKILLSNLKKAFNEFSNKNNCFFQYGILDDNVLSDISININTEKDKTYLTVVKGKQVLEINELKLKPCVINGEKNGKAVAQLFLDKLINSKNVNDYYNSVGNIQFIKSGKIEYLYDNIKSSSNLEDQGWLFVTNGMVCFMPTYTWDINLGCSANENGLDNDCFLNPNDKKGIVYGLNSGKLTKC